jgi:hypothetical protein
MPFEDVADEGSLIRGATCLDLRDLRDVPRCA